MNHTQADFALRNTKLGTGVCFGLDTKTLTHTGTLVCWLPMRASRMSIHLVLRHNLGFETYAFLTSRSRWLIDRLEFRDVASLLIWDAILWKLMIQH